MLCWSLGWRPHEESNLDLRFRKPLFYPLNYGDFGMLLKKIIQELSRSSFGKVDSNQDQVFRLH